MLLAGSLSPKQRLELSRHRQDIGMAPQLQMHLTLVAAHGSGDAVASYNHGAMNLPELLFIELRQQFFKRHSQQSIHIAPIHLPDYAHVTRAGFKVNDLGNLD